MVGIGLIAFVFAGGRSQLANAVLLACSAFFLMMLTVLQLGHVWSCMTIADCFQLLH